MNKQNLAEHNLQIKKKTTQLCHIYAVRPYLFYNLYIFDPYVPPLQPRHPQHAQTAQIRTHGTWRGHESSRKN